MLHSRKIYNLISVRFCSTSRSTLQAEELVKFRKLADEWWDAKGPFKALHSLNKLRVPFVRNGILSYQPRPFPQSFPLSPLLGYKILDVGCGGGILSESLARLGAQVTAIDPCQESISAASLRAQKLKLKNLNYEVKTLEELEVSISSGFDAIVASEVIEHVDGPEFFIQMCADLLKPGGSLFLTTINKNMLSWVLGIVAAEYVMNLVPKGTHDWTKFISPHKLISITNNNDCQVRQLQGMTYNPFTNKWFWIQDLSINYALHVTKNKDVPSNIEPSPEHESS